MVRSRLFTDDDAIQETVTFSLVFVQQNPTKLHTAFLMFLCEHSWDPPGANFAVFQRDHHRFQRNEAYIQLRAKFRSRNPPIRADKLIQTLFFSWCDSCAWPSGTWLVFKVAVTTAERATHHLTVLTPTVWSP